ncbi:MAG: hypothetical protein ACYTGQ_17090, partial [Planctomycetota bacterium]
MTRRQFIGFTAFVLSLAGAAPLWAQERDRPGPGSVLVRATELHKQGKLDEARRMCEARARALMTREDGADQVDQIVTLVDLAMYVPDPYDTEAPKPNYRLLHTLYEKLLMLQLNPEQQEHVMFQSAFASHKAEFHFRAVDELRQYLERYDPDYAPRDGGRPPAKTRGRYAIEARYRLGKSLLGLENLNAARNTWKRLAALLAKAPAGLMDAKTQSRLADTRWQIVRTYAMPEV